MKYCKPHKQNISCYLSISLINSSWKKTSLTSIHCHYLNTDPHIKLTTFQYQYSINILSIWISWKLMFSRINAFLSQWRPFEGDSVALCHTICLCSSKSCLKYRKYIMYKCVKSVQIWSFFCSRNSLFRYFSCRVFMPFC